MRKTSAGFTLVELILVIGILTVILAMTLIAVNPAEQVYRAADSNSKAVADDLIKTTVSYYTSAKKLPWDKNVGCSEELETKELLSDMPNCIRELTGDSKQAEDYLKQPELKEIHISKCGDSAVLCYSPKSKIEYEDAQTKYNRYGVSIPGCPGKDRNSPDCYWCRPLMKSRDCLVDDPAPTPPSSPSQTPISSPTPYPLPPTSTPIPTPTPYNPWGQAAVFGGKVAGRNPPSNTPVPQYFEVPYASVMNLSSNNLTVEAWIKPEVPTAAGYSYRIVDNTYRLTMDARPNGADVSYIYYFDVQSSTNGCNQTVVYSGTCTWNPWDLCNYKTVSPSEFSAWKHVAGVLQNGNLHLYENGVRLNSYNIAMTVCNDSRGFHVGAGLFGKMMPFYDYFQGVIDEVRVSRVARYSENFTPAKLPFTPDSNTLMLYHFDSDTSDSSSNSLNGHMTGDVYFIPSTVPIN